QGLSHVLVQLDGVRVLHELPHHLALFILHHYHLFRLGHAPNHDVAELHREGQESRCSTRKTETSAPGRLRGAGGPSPRGAGPAAHIERGRRAQPVRDLPVQV
ncbi:unnamed protein product, partial [Ixodes pacificus]